MNPRLGVMVCVAVLGAILLVAGIVSLLRGKQRRWLLVFLGLVLTAAPLPTLVTQWRTLASVWRSDFEDAAQLARLRDEPLATAAPTAMDWPQWRGPNRDGIGRAPGMSLDWEKKSPELVWSTPGGAGYSSLAIANGRVWTQDFHDGQERIVCLDATNGKEIWSYRYPTSYAEFGRGYANGPRATPTVYDGRVYALGATGTFLCLDADPADGKPKVHWQHDLRAEFQAPLPPWGFASSPLVEGDVVIVQPGGKSGSVAAFHRVSGEKAWSVLDERAGYSSPIGVTAAGQRQILAFTAGGLCGLRPHDGHQLWSFAWPTEFDANIATPIVAGDLVFISSGYNTGCALLRLEPDGAGVKAERVWVRPRKLMRNHHMTCVLRDGHIYGFDDGRGDLKCIDLRTQAEKWETQRVGKGCLILAEEHLIILSQDGTLSLVEATPDAFRLKGKRPNVLRGADCWALPALAGGRLYLRDHEKVICLKLD